MSEVISHHVLATKVLFSKGITHSSGRIQWFENTASGSNIVVDQTPFHPVSHIWPDHPADKGQLLVAGIAHQVTDCVTGAFNCESNELFMGADIPVKRGEEGWHFVVVHQLDSSVVVKVNDAVELIVDEHYQSALSRGHSAGHLASFALNKVLEQGYWRKDASRKDALNNRDFHSYAQTLSLVSENQSTDSYRLGKTLKKRGFNVADMFADLAEIETNVNHVLTEWLATKAEVTLECEGGALTDSRYWHCDLGNGEHISMPCGGSHVQSLAEYTCIEIKLTQNSDQDLEMITTAS